MSEFDPVGLLVALADGGVEFVVIGNAAAVMHGAAVMSLDVDICPRRDIDNAEALAAALAAIGGRVVVDPRGDTDAGHPVDERVFHGWRNVRVVTRLGPLDVVPHPAGLDGYEALNGTAERLQVRGHDIAVARLDDVIASKEALGRVKDRAALPSLYAAQRRLRGQGGDAAT